MKNKITKRHTTKKHVLKSIVTALIKRKFSATKRVKQNKFVLVQIDVVDIIYIVLICIIWWFTALFDVMRMTIRTLENHGINFYHIFVCYI